MIRRLIFVLAMVAAATATASDASAATVCVVTAEAYPPGDVAKLCAGATSGTDPFLLGQWKDSFAIQKVINLSTVRPIPPATIIPPPPTKITDCSAVPATPPYSPPLVSLKICGPRVLTRTTDTIKGSSTPVRSPCAQPGDPCHQRPSTVVGPGLLEGDSGFATQGPAAAGTAVTSRPAGGSAATGTAPAGIPGRR